MVPEMRNGVRPGGHTVIELMVALSILAMVGAATQGLLRRGFTSYREHQAAMQAEQSGRIVLSALALELQDLDAADQAGGDVLEVTSSSITYRSMMNMYFVCRPPDPSAGRVTVRDNLWVGTQALDGTTDQVLIMAQADSAHEHWLKYPLRGLETGRDCPSGEGSVSLLLDAASFRALAGVPVGAPVLGYRVTRVQSYQDGEGVWWLGLQTQSPLGTWALTQPIAGPLAPGGLLFTFRDGSGRLVAEPGSVGRIGIRLVSVVRARKGIVLETEVWLRNNPRQIS
jgi:type II secretory pathway pseudopilin PulG